MFHLKGSFIGNNDRGIVVEYLAEFGGAIFFDGSGERKKLIDHTRSDVEASILWLHGAETLNV